MHLCIVLSRNMRAFAFLRSAFLVLNCFVSGFGRGQKPTIDSDALKSFATFLLAQQKGPAFATHPLLYHRSSLGQPTSRESLHAIMDSDRCYYGDLDADGNVLSGRKERKERQILEPSPSNTPRQVIDAQFLALSRDYDSRSMEDAFAHVSPKIVNQHNLDAAKFKAILSGPKMDGIIGCDSWEVLSESSPSDDKMIMSLKIIPKPIPGCVKTSGLAGQGGITWPMFYDWELGKVTEGPLEGCWMLEQMIPKASPEMELERNIQKAVDA